MGDELRDSSATPRMPTTIGAVARGAVAEEAAAPRPTVIGGTPRVPGGSGPATLDGAASRLPVGQAVGGLGSERLPVPAPRVPSQMNGTVRRAVSIDGDSLARLLPGVPAPRLGEVVDLMGSVVLETLSTVRAAAWGEGVQRAYAEFVHDALVCARAPILEEGVHRLQRLYVIFDEFSSVLNPDVSNFRALLRGQASPRTLVDKHRVELDQLRRHLDDVLPKLEAVQGTHAALAARASRLSVSLQNHALAAQALAELVAHSDAGVDRVLVERGMSLVRAGAQLRESELNRATQAARLDILVVTIRDVALGALPAWVEQATYAQSPTPTERYGLYRGVLDLLTNLRPRY